MPIKMDELYRLIELKLNTPSHVDTRLEPMSDHSDSYSSHPTKLPSKNDADRETELLVSSIIKIYFYLVYCSGIWMLQLPKTPFPSPDASTVASPRGSGGGRAVRERSESGRDHPYQRVPRHKTSAHKQAELRRQEKIKVS